MNIKLIISIAVAVLLVIFAVQNAGEVIIKFFGLEFTGSLSLFLILGILIGAIIGSLFTISLKWPVKKVKDKKTDVIPPPDNKTDLKG